MRYWLLTTEYPPLYGGGISTYCAITARMLQREGHNVTVFVHDFSISDLVESSTDGIRLIRFHPRQTDANLFMGYTAYLSYEFSAIVKKYLEREGKPDIIEVQEYGAIAYYLLQFKWQCIPPFNGIKVVVTCHSPSFICLEYNQVPVYRFPDYWTGEMEKACIRSADHVIFPSNYLVKELQKKLSLEGVCYSVVPNPEPTFRPANDGVVTDEQLIVCFGKLAPLKGTFPLLKNFDALWKAGSQLKLYIIGGTDYFFYPESKTMRDVLVTKYGKYIDEGRLVLTGNLSPDAYTPYLQRAKLIIVPSLFDNFPYTVLESMSFGKVILASRQGGQTEMIRHGENGFLFDHFVDGDFAIRLHEILALDQNTLATISNNSRNSVSRKFSAPSIYPQKMQVLNAVLSDDSACRDYPFITPIRCIPGTEQAIGHTSGNTPLLSVVIPYYNMGIFAAETLQSVFASDYNPIEVLIIDDGSTDAQSIAQLEAFEKQYPVRIIRKSNSGLAATRNFGAEEARGTYLAFLDPDDIVEPAYYSKAISILERYDNVHFVGCWLTYFGEGKGTWPTFNPEPPYVLVHNMINSSAVVFKRRTFLQRGTNDVDMIYGMEDWETVVRLVGSGYRGVVIPEKLFHYRVRKDSMSQAFTTEKQLYLTRLIAEKNKFFYDAYGHEVFQLLNSNGSAIYFDNPTFEVVQRIPLKRLSYLKNRIKEYIKRNKALRMTAYFIYKRIK